MTTRKANNGKATPSRGSLLCFAIQCCIAAFLTCHAACAWAEGAGIDSRLSQVYFEGETPSFAVTGQDGTFRWWIENWRGEKVREGEGVGGTPVEVSGLPPGFWRFEVAGGASSPFSVLVEPSTRRAVKSSPYGIDAALSWVAAPKSFYRPVAENSYYYVVDLLKAAGVVATRERMSVAEVYGKDGKTFNWGKYLDNARYQKKQGIRISGMFQNLPPWMEQEGRKGRFDLVKIRDFCRKCAETFGDAMEDWEFLNEEESYRTPWVYAAMAKAASIGFHAANPDLVFASMGISTSIDGPWHATLAENGLLAYLGVYNTHSYTTFDKYEAGHSRVRNYLKRNGFADLPILYSENGTLVEGSATVPTANEKFMAHSPEQELVVADFIPKSFVLRQFAGIWRTLYFTFPPYSEGGGKKDWGVLRRDGSAKPGIAAISTITSELQGLECLGRLDLGDGVSAYLYQDGDDSRQVIAFWSEDGKKTISVMSTVPARLVDWCGTPRELGVGNLSLRAEQHISYLHGAFGLPVAEKPHPAGKPRPYAFAADQEPNVVIVAYFDEDDFSETDSKSAMAAQIDSKWRATIEVWNLSGQPKKGRLVAADGVKAVGVPGEIEIPAGSVVSLPVTLQSESGTDGWAWLRIHGEFDGRRTSPFAVRILDSGKLLANCLKVDGKCDAPEDWEKNTSADRRTVEADGEGGVKFFYFWEKQFANKWFYPRMSVPEQAMKTLEYVEWETKSSQDRPENSYLTANIYCVFENGRHLQVRSASPSRVWEKRLVHVMHSEDGSPIVKIEIGGNPDGKEVEYHVRNVRFYYRPEAAKEDVALPVRPGDPEKGIPFWNDYATMFRYAPAFSFDKIKGAVRYRITARKQGVERSFEADVPWAPLSPIWRELPNGTGYEATCEGLDASGKVVGKSEVRRFTKTAAFEEVSLPGAKCSYVEAARRIYDYMTSLPAMRTLVETGEPEQTYQHNAYVAKTHAAHIKYMLAWAGRDEQNRKRAMEFAKASAEYLLGELEPADAPLAFWPPTYGRKPLRFDPGKDGPETRNAMKGNEPEGAVKYRGQVMLVYPASAGEAFVAYYKVTGDRRFLDAAIGIARTYLKVRRADGTWPLKMVLATGEPIGRNVLVPSCVLNFFEKLAEVDEKGGAEWRREADKCLNALLEGPVRTMNWDGQFEDIEPKAPYMGLTKHNALDTMMVLLRRYPHDAEKLRIARELLRFSEDQFVFWEAPCSPDEEVPAPGVGARSEPPRTGKYGRYDYPAVFEQYSCYCAIDSSASKLIRSYLAMYRVTHDQLDLRKARALADMITRMQKPSGRVPTFWTNSWASEVRYDWLNCMASSAAALLECAEASGEVR